MTFLVWFVVGTSVGLAGLGALALLAEALAELGSRRRRRPVVVLDASPLLRRGLR